MRRTVRVRAGFVAAVAAAVVVVFAAPAAAHVTITPTSAQQGGSANVSFNVPNEENSSTTVKVEINFPPDAPVVGVVVRPVPGWTETVENTKLATPITNDDGDQVTEAVSKITFTASPGAAIRPGEFQQFVISIDPLPKTSRMVFKAVQYYANGDIVRWIDLPNPGAEPDHPAPVLTLSAASSDSPAAAATITTTGSGNSAAVLGLLGLVAGVSALVVSILAYRKVNAGIRR
jgi:periplasmic copper chaperone A